MILRFFFITPQYILACNRRYCFISHPRDLKAERRLHRDFPEIVNARLTAGFVKKKVYNTL